LFARVLAAAIDQVDHVADMTLIRPRGMGLVGSDMEAVSKWIFKPAEVNGTNKTARILIDIQLHLS